MINIGRIQGSKEQAKPLIVGKDTVYVHTNIIKIEKDIEENETDNLYEYDEVQYTKDEYIKIMAEKNKELDEQVTEIQLAMVEMAESEV